jgi:bifunctional non-homologous end joining protein LigD
VAAARLVRARLQAHGLESFVKDDGRRGPPHSRADRARTELGRVRALLAGRREGLVREAPDAFVAIMGKTRRRGRIFVDWLRNVRGATSVAAYSTRANTERAVSTAPHVGRDSARVRCPIASHRRDPNAAALGRWRADPWAGFWATRQALPTSRRAATENGQERGTARVPGHPSQRRSGPRQVTLW